MACVLLVGFGLLLLAMLFGPLREMVPFQVATVESGSMEPALPVGSALILRKTASNNVHVGDIITFSRPGSSVRETHRVVGMDVTSDDTAFITKGDANPLPDSWRVPVSGTGWVYQFQVPYLGYLLSLINPLHVRFVIASIPVLALGGAILLPLWFPSGVTKGLAGRTKLPMPKA